MIVNVPLVFDDDAIQKKMDDAGYERCIAELMGDIRKSFLGRYCRKTSISDEDLRQSMREIVEIHVDKFLTDYKDDIVKYAGDRLAQRVIHSKKFKEKVEEVME